MNVFFSLLIFSFFAAGSDAQVEPNFSCNIFVTVDGGIANGSLSLSGEDFSEQTYKLTFSEADNEEPRQFDGTVYLRGSVEFTELTTNTQKAILRAMKNSRRVGLSTGALLLFANTPDNSDMSTLNIYLMPNGQIGYVEIGFLPVLCM